MDPDSGLENSAHVLDQNGKIFSATLGLVDIVRGTNSYYKLQLLEDDVHKRLVYPPGKRVLKGGHFLSLYPPHSPLLSPPCYSLCFPCISLPPSPLPLSCPHSSSSHHSLSSPSLSSVCRYWVFRSWGRVGTTNGGKKLDKFNDKNSAMDNFLGVYEEKTGNAWGSSHFTKYPNRFYPLEIDYGQVQLEHTDTHTGPFVFIFKKPVVHLT